MSILNRLIAIQNALGLSDRAFAEKLSVSHATWSDTKKGAVPIRYEVLSGAVRAFRREYPAVGADALDYLEAAQPGSKRRRKDETAQVATV